MVKKCLTETLERPYDFGEIATTSALFVAIASPHSKSSNPKVWNLPELLIRTHGYRKKGSAASEQDAKMLAELCKRYESVASNLDVVTLCETEATTRRGLFGRPQFSSRILLAPKVNCTVNTRREVVIDIEANHMNICDIIPAHYLKNCLETSLQKIRARLETRSLDDSVPSIKSVLDESSIAHLNAANGPLPGDAPLCAKNDSVQATMTVSDSRKSRLDTLADFAVAKRDPLLPCHIIPRNENRDFQGRNKVLARIESYLSPTDAKGEPRKDLRSFAVCGPGGIGKTEVANEFALSHLDMYEVILWVHAEDATSLADEFSQIAETLGLVLGGTSDAADLIVTRELVKGWLAKPVRSYSRADNKVEEVLWLLIFDNLDDPDLLAEYWPSIGSCGAVLVTRRDGLAKTPFYQIEQGIDLPPLDNGTAADLLLRLTWREGLPQERLLSASVADKLGGLPLALRQMAGVMVRQSLSFADFMRRYDEAETHEALFSMSLEPRLKRTNYEHTIASVWGLDSLKHSSGLFDVLAFLDAKGIPEFCLEQAVGVLKLAGYPKTVSESCGTSFAWWLLINQPLVAEQCPPIKRGVGHKCPLSYPRILRTVSGITGAPHISARALHTTAASPCCAAA